MILQYLRSAGDQEITQRELAIKIHGADDWDERRAISLAMWRLRHIWGTSGLEIELRQARRRLDRDAETYYRLTHDVDDAVIGMAS